MLLVVDDPFIVGLFKELYYREQRRAIASQEAQER